MKRILILILSFIAGLAIGLFVAQPKHKTDTLDGSLRTKSKDTYKHALKQSRESNQAIFLFFSKDKDSDCVAMKEVFKDAEIKERLKKYFWVEVKERPDLVEKWSVEGFPTLIIISGKETPLKRHNGALDKNEFVEWMGSF